MEKLIRMILFTALFGCGEPSQDGDANSKFDSTSHSDDPVSKTPATSHDKETKVGEALPKKTYANQRFRKVTVEKAGDRKYLVKGEAQIFEANFSWVVEEGKKEILSGHQMTNAGAPEWGKFSFTLDCKSAPADSQLTLILFEASAKDGSRQHQLPIVLEE